MTLAVLWPPFYSMTESTLIQQLSNALPWIAALVGGVLDYANEIRRGSKSWSLIGFTLHCSSAVFFGWVVYSLAGHFGYGGDAAGAAAGLGGFMGTRCADILVSLFPKAKAGS